MATQQDHRRWLTQTDHDRDVAGLTYVYPVVSRRAGGVSIGVNLNPNNACNWACLYCQVPDLRRGNAPSLDLPQLERELSGFVEYVLHGDFMQTRVPEGARRLNDIAISGNGEPTTSRSFETVVDIVGKTMRRHALVGKIKLVLISNGSGIARPQVQRGLSAMAALGGEVWFKLDRATREGTAEINGVAESPAAVARRLAIAARLCPTWLQTCLFAIDGNPPSPKECDAWLRFVRARLDEGVALRGVLLYGLARPSLQPGAGRLSKVSDDWLAALAKRVRELGVEVRVTP